LAAWTVAVEGGILAPTLWYAQDRLDDPGDWRDPQRVDSAFHIGRPTLVNVADETILAYIRGENDSPLGPLRLKHWRRGRGWGKLRVQTPVVSYYTIAVGRGGGLHFLMSVPDERSGNLGPHAGIYLLRGFNCGMRR
jgi:hypothetical protein